MIINQYLKTVIVLFSPNGSTLKIAKEMEKEFLKKKIKTEIIDLTGRSWEEISNFNYSVIDEYDLFIIGFPVYAWKIVEPLEVFLSNMPTVKYRYAGIFATYGGVTVGKALIDAAKILDEKGYIILGAAKIVAAHSNVFEKEKDPFHSHPNEIDMEKINSLSHVILKKINNPNLKSIQGKTLKSNSRLINFLLKSPIAKRFSRQFPPGIRFNKKKCIKCGLCAKACPLKIIELNPFPEKKGKCIKCHNCKRVCPQNAIITTGLLRKKIFHFGLQKLLMKTGGERPWSEIYA